MLQELTVRVVGPTTAAIRVLTSRTTTSSSGMSHPSRRKISRRTYDDTELDKAIGHRLCHFDYTDADPISGDGQPYSPPRVDHDHEPALGSLNDLHRAHRGGHAVDCRRRPMTLSPALEHGRRRCLDRPH